VCNFQRFNATLMTCLLRDDLGQGEGACGLPSVAPCAVASSLAVACHRPPEICQIKRRHPTTPSYTTALLLIALAYGSCSGESGPGSGPTPSQDLPVGHIKHVFMIVLENKNFDAAFGPSSEAPYLAQILVPQGQLLSSYHGIGHRSLPNDVALISGQAPNEATAYADFVSTRSVDADGQAVGTGCVYPPEIKTIANQLTEHGLTWRASIEDMDNDSSSPYTCRHPLLGAVDMTQFTRVGDQYATQHNPFVYFHSVIDSSDCETNDVPLTRLSTDLSNVQTTASFSFVTPNLCNSGHDDPCVDGSPGGLVAVNAFLKIWVPQILDSPAYKDGGLLIITFDEAESDTASCCHESTSPNVTAPGVSGPGGGPNRRGGALTVCTCRNYESYAIQPLFFAADARSSLRPAEPGLCRTARVEDLRDGRVLVLITERESADMPIPTQLKRLGNAGGPMCW
jgi:phosphatidylinositol-3-phosphatase